MNKTNKLLPILLILNLVMTIAIIVFLFIGCYADEKKPPQGTEVVNYTLYIGLNDKDTYTQEIPTDEARAIVDSICIKHVSAFTTSDAQGAWTDDIGVLSRENTLVYMFTDAKESQITAIMDELLVALNQSSILVNVNSVQMIQYSGK